MQKGHHNAIAKPSKISVVTTNEDHNHIKYVCINHHGDVEANYQWVKPQQHQPASHVTQNLLLLRHLSLLRLLSLPSIEVLVILVTTLIWL
ncbi:hypothetical protein LZ757_04810 [Xylella fastidiosa subsp. morus]|jgi:hypothetical protein|uniref:Uncharacterized protein n=2 Tax=Xylella fastidiosa TaxID=2371 RepID=A0AAJ5UHI7_XYLFS|nr:hypothetical protein [Xylella fastidiosa]KAF0570579.1 hypothetical protein P305_02805 [Xylella fastidiosa subsp. fastidiosa Mus-1]AIC13801.1 hypothetical protein P303_06100 [Xylella fastidiosa MUL0034]EWG15369.1 hypothetical protein P910_001668 [Xylella fastidiosa Mul-MD]KGM20009.1 hypothetical protein JT24_07155 [Xylella fastidiosa]MDC7964324.1 hypothetical protein [Xylella fastidiosa]